MAAEYGATPAELVAIAADIPARVDALLGRWEHPHQLWALLAMVHEEAWHYQPAAVPLLARALTVAGVRNSALESAHAAGHLPPSALRLVTASVAARMAHGLPSLGNPVPAAPDGPRPAPGARPDPFAELAARFPAAWAAFSVLAALQRWDFGASAGPRQLWAEREFTAVPAAPVRIGDLAAAGGHHHHDGAWVLDGMAPGVGPPFLAALEDCDVMGCTSIRALSRNPAVVLAVVEYLLGGGKSLVTANALIEPGYVACRAVPRKPDPAAFATGAVLSGVSARHSASLRLCRAT